MKTPPSSRISTYCHASLRWPELSALIFCTLLSCAQAQPCHLTVTNNADSGPGTLREALAQICAGGTIDFAVSGTISLTTGHLDFNNSVSIVGPGAANLTLSGGSLGRVVYVHPAAGTVSVSELTIANGWDQGPNEDGNPIGGGIFNRASLALTECVISNNVANTFGGGVGNLVEGTLIVNRCLFVGNHAVNAFQGGSFGGAVFNQGKLYVTNTTFSENISDFTGGAIGGNSPMVLDSCTITRNSISPCVACEGPRTGGVYNGGGETVDVQIQNTIMAGNTNVIAGDIHGFVASGDYNLIGDPSQFTPPPTSTHNLLGVDPLLNPLADNDGPTLTHLPRSKSPVRDSASPANFPSVDQRGVSRPKFKLPDIGAVEYRGQDNQAGKR